MYLYHKSEQQMEYPVQKTGITTSAVSENLSI